MPVVGIAEVLVKPVFNGVQNQIARQMDGASERAGRSAGGKMGRGMSRGFAPAAAGITAGLMGIIPAAGAASAAVLATGGSVITLTSSLSSLAGVAALVPAGLMSVAAGAGVLVSAFSGMGEALKTAVDASNAVATTNPRLAAMAVEDAMQSIADAEANAADAAEAASRRIADAKRALSEAVESAAEAQVSAARAVEMAERSEARAARDVIATQEDLVAAREEAADRVDEVSRSLEGANRRAAETALAYKKAADLYAAAKANSNTSGDEMSWLENNAAKALAADKDAKLAVIDLQEQRTKAQIEATSGSKKILAAEQRLADEQQAQSDAIQARKDAQADVVKTEKSGAQQVADAQQAITDATRDAEKSQVDAARAVADAYRGLERVQLQQADAAAATGAKAAAAMDKLTPSAREAALALLAVKDQLGGIRRIAQENFFKGFAAPLLSLAGSVMPQLATGVGAIASAMGSGAQTYMGALESSLGGGVLESLLMGVARSTQILNTAITPVVEAFTTLGVVGMPYMARLSQFIADVAVRFNDFIQVTAADGRLAAWIDGGIQTLKDLWSIAGSVIGVFESLNKAAEAGGLGTTVGGLAAGMRDLDAAMKSETFQTTMATLFSGAAQGAEGLRGALDNISGAFVRGAAPMAEFMRLGGEISGTFIGGVFDAFSDPTFGAGLLTFMGGLQRGAEAVAPLLPGMFAGFGNLLTSLAPLAEVMGPTLVLVLTGMANGLAKVIEFLNPVLVAIGSSPTLMGVAIIGLALLSSAWARMGISAMINGIKVAASWATMGTAALVSGAQTAYVWGLYALEAIKGAASFVLNAGRVVGGWVLMGVQSLIQAGRMALAWFIALGPIGWVIAAVIGLAAIIIANWDTISSFTRDMWEKHVKPVFDALGNFITKDVPKAFEQGVGFIKTIWEGLQDIAKAPVRFVIDTVINDGLINGLNGIGGFLNLPKIPRLELPAGFMNGGYTGNGGKDEPMGVVHGGEFVLTKEQTRKAGVRNLYALAKSLDGFADGGFVNPLKSLSITQGYNRVHKGVDFAASVGTPVFATENGRVSWSGPGARAPGVWGGNEIHVDGGSGIQSWFAHLSSMAVKVGDMVRAGQQIATSGNTGISSGPHLHFGTFAGGWPNDVNPLGYLSGAGLPSGGGFNPLAGIIDGLLSRFKDAFPAGGFIADLAIGVGKKLFGGVTDLITGGKGSATGLSRGPSLYDLGGILPPGISQVVNRTGKPEAILNPQQWSDIHRLATLRGSGTAAGQTNKITINQVDDPVGTSIAVARRLRALSG